MEYNVKQIEHTCNLHMPALAGESWLQRSWMTDWRIQTACSTRAGKQLTNVLECTRTTRLGIWLEHRQATSFIYLAEGIEFEAPENMPEMRTMIEGDARLLLRGLSRRILFL
jgi:hypothetical protein